MNIKLGPAGIGGIKESKEVLEMYHKTGISAAEIPFTYGVWMTNEQANEIGKIADKNKITLSCHAPYWINLNSDDKTKIEQSKKRILSSAERIHHLGGGIVVFHPGYYGKMKEDETFAVIVEEVRELAENVRSKLRKLELKEI